MEEKNPAKTESGEKSFEEKLNAFLQKIKPHISLLWGERKKFILLNAAVFAAAILYLLFLISPAYQGTVTILPEYGSKSASISGLSQIASLAGVKVGEGAPTEIYQNLITSESVLEPVILKEYKTEKFDNPVNLFEYYEIEKSGNSYSRRDYLALFKGLRGSINTKLDRFTRILDISVTMPESQLAADVANELVESLDMYIRTKRKSYALEQIYYLEKRTAQVRDSLTKAEEKLKVFREQNRIVTHSPQLMLEQGRMMREVEILQTVYIELNKQLEIARIDDIRETPVVNLKEPAKDPVIKAGPRRLNSLITIMIFSILLSAAYFILKPHLKRYYSIIKS
jgi:uncharacterized protein involved in exopolysaccharide biosynthesis